MHFPSDNQALRYLCLQKVETHKSDFSYKYCINLLKIILDIIISLIDNGVEKTYLEDTSSPSANDFHHIFEKHQILL